MIQYAEPSPPGPEAGPYCSLFPPVHPYVEPVRQVNGYVPLTPGVDQPAVLGELKVKMVEPGGEGGDEGGGGAGGGKGGGEGVRGGKGDHCA